MCTLQLNTTSESYLQFISESFHVGKLVASTVNKLMSNHAVSSTALIVCIVTSMATGKGNAGGLCFCTAGCYIFWTTPLVSSYSTVHLNIYHQPISYTLYSDTVGYYILSWLVGSSSFNGWWLSCWLICGWGRHNSTQLLFKGRCTFYHATIICNSL